MANTVSVLSYANTFADWVVVTNASATELNSIGKGNWTKDGGTLTVDSGASSTGLQVNNATVLRGTVTVTSGQIYIQNTSLGLVNSGNATFGGTLLANNLTASGNVYFGDSLLKLANNNLTGDSVDIGFYGPYYSSSAAAIRYSGIARQASSGKFIVFNNVTTDPGAANVISGYSAAQRANLDVNIVGGTVSGLAAAITTSDGGTGTTTSPTQGGVAYGTGSAIAYSALGTAGQYLKSSGTSAPVWASIPTTNPTPYLMTINNSGTGNTSPTIFDGSNTTTISFNTIGAPGIYGNNATGIWNINVNGTTTYANIANTLLGFTTGQNTLTTSNVQFRTIGVGTTPDTANNGTIRAIGNITAYYSDERLKKRLGNIENALDKVMALTGFYYEANEVAQALGYVAKREVGLSAQDVQKVLPEVTPPAPIDPQYLTVQYERLIPLLVEAIKELKVEVDNIKGKI